MPQPDLYDQLIAKLNPDTSRDAKGRIWAHITCPACGHESTPRRHHCSFSEEIWHCFACGETGSLWDLAKRLNIQNPQVYQPRKKAEPTTNEPPGWLHKAPRLVDGYCKHPHRLKLWDAYKKLPHDLIETQRLGVGVLPASKCKHNRLIVPIYFGTEIVGLRGRAIDCDCGKWLAPGGTRPDLYPLYGVGDVAGKVVWLVENPIDALKVNVKTPYIGRATYSTGYWYPHWLQSLQDAELVVVCYDNDLTGNGGADQRAEFIKLWYTQHPKATCTPPSKGVERVNELNAIRHNWAILYNWKRAEHKADVGGLLA